MSLLSSLIYTTTPTYLFHQIRTILTYLVHGCCVPSGHRQVSDRFSPSTPQVRTS